MNQLFRSLERLQPQSLKMMADQIYVLIETKLWAKVLTGMVLGIGLGVLLSPSGPLAESISAYQKTIEATVSWLALPAKFFLKIIKMVIIPLIFSSIIRGLASTTDVSQMKSMGLKFTGFVLANTCLGALIGITLTKLIAPGEGLSLRGTAAPGAAPVAADSMFTFNPETILDFLPSNPLSSFVEGQMLDVVILSIIAGIAILSIEREQAKGVMDTLEVVQKVCMQIISWAMRIAPYAVFGMMVQVTSTTGLKALQNMAMYVVVCFLGFVTLLAFYGLLVSVFSRTSPIAYLKIASTPLLLAFSTSSSAATMPVTMKTAEDELGVHPPVARFLIPLGTTVNMAGSAIWQTSAVIFLSQIYDIQLSLAQISIVAATSVASSIGSPGVPGVGVGILASVLVKVGVPIEGISLVMGVDRIIDMGCTTVNVAGDLTASKLFGDKQS